MRRRPCEANAERNPQMSNTYAVQPPTGRKSIAKFATETGKVSPIVWSRQLRDFMTNLVGRGMQLEDAARDAGIRIKRARNLQTHPEFIKEYERRVEILRANEKARNIHKAISVRDDEALTSPAGRKVQLDAAKWLHGESDGNSNTARVGVHVSLGYVIDLSGDKGKPALVIDGQAGPSSNVPTADARKQAIDLTDE